MPPINELVKQALNNQNASPIRRNQYNPTQGLTGGFESEFSSDFGSNFTSEFAFNPDLNTSEGLYRLANQAGLKKDADKIVAANTGEEYKKIFSGGFISDVFDVANVLSYGTVGLLKGKGFSEGIKNRESFSDKDSMGQYGLMGVIGGFALDIVTDPLTYVAPWTLLRKVPGVTRIGKAGKDFIVGREVTEVAGETGETFTKLEGGFAGGKARELIQKVSYMFGADPQFKEAHDRMMAMIGKETTQAMGMVKHLAKLEPNKVEGLLTRDENGRFIRRSLDELKRDMSEEDFALVAPIWENIDNLGRRLVDVGVLGEKKYEENLGKYIRSMYSEYELAKNKGLWGFKKVGIKPQKARKDIDDVTELKDLTQIDDPAYILGRTMVQMISDLHNAEFLKDVSKFASKTEFEGSVRVPDTRKFSPTQGRQAELKQQILDINKQITPTLRHLKQTFKADKDVLKEIRAIEKEIGTLSGKRADELFNFFNEGDVITKTAKVPRKLGTMPQRLEPLAQKMKKYDNFEDMVVSRDGIRLQKLWNEGILERHGFKGGEKAMRNFFEQSKRPYKAERTQVVEKELQGNIPKLIKLQSRIEKLTDKAENLRGIDKKSIDNSFINLENTLNNLRLDKDDLMDEIYNNKLSDLAGKHIPKEMWDYIDEVVNPTEPFGNRVIGEFKYMKVVLSPGTHIRNILSNRILNWWKLGIGPWRLDLDVAARQAISKQNKHWKEWTDLGGGADTYAAAELPGLIEDIPHTHLKGAAGRWWGKAKKRMGDIYQGEEAHAKLSAFIALRRRGLSPEEAFKGSQSATFNYAQVTPFIRKMRTALWGVPFITFPLKATPIALETAVKAPHRIGAFGKIRNDIMNASEIQETEEELASEPPWVKEGFYFKLPIKDKEGRSAYFDLTYIVPFGDIVSGQFFQRNMRRETGTLETVPVALASNNPVFQFLKEITRNETFTGDKVFRETDDMDEQFLHIMNHALKTFSPPWLSAQLPKGFDKRTGELKPGGLAASTQAAEDNTRRNVRQEVAGYLGMKIQPIDAEINSSYQEWNKRRGLETLLLENNIVNEFTKVYQPKQ